MKQSLTLKKLIKKPCISGQLVQLHESAETKQQQTINFSEKSTSKSEKTTE